MLVGEEDPRLLDCVIAVVTLEGRVVSDNAREELFVEVGQESVELIIFACDRELLEHVGHVRPS